MPWRGQVSRTRTSRFMKVLFRRPRLTTPQERMRRVVRDFGLDRARTRTGLVKPMRTPAPVVLFPKRPAQGRRNKTRDDITLLDGRIEAVAHLAGTGLTRGLGVH